MKNTEKIIQKTGRIIQKVIVYSLIALMTALLILATIELGYYTFKHVIESTSVVIDLSQLMELFGIFMLVLIGIELLDTIKVYLKDNVLHVEVVILVAIIAVARKVVVLDIENIDGLKIIGLAFIIVALAVAYYLIRESGLLRCSFYENEQDKIVEQEK